MCVSVYLRGYRSEAVGGCVTRTWEVRTGKGDNRESVCYSVQLLVKGSPRDDLWRSPPRLSLSLSHSLSLLLTNSLWTGTVIQNPPNCHPAVAEERKPLSLIRKTFWKTSDWCSVSKTRSITREASVSEARP